MLRTVLAIVCLMSLTACGLKGPLYLPERAPQPASPMATPVPTSPFAEDGAQGESDAQNSSSQTPSPLQDSVNSSLESSTMLAPSP